MDFLYFLPHGCQFIQSLELALALCISVTPGKPFHYDLTHQIRQAAVFLFGKCSQKSMLFWFYQYFGLMGHLSYEHTPTQV